MQTEIFHLLEPDWAQNCSGQSISCRCVRFTRLWIDNHAKCGESVETRENLFPSLVISETEKAGHLLMGGIGSTLNLLNSSQSSFIKPENHCEVRLRSCTKNRRPFCSGTVSHAPVRPNPVWETGLGDKPVGTQSNEGQAQGLINPKSRAPVYGLIENGPIFVTCFEAN